MDVVVAECIAKFLPIHDIGALIVLCKGSRRIADSQSLFKFLSYRDFNLSSEKLNPDWKQFYQILYHTKLNYLHKLRIHFGLICQPKQNIYEYAIFCTAQNKDLTQSYIHYDCVSVSPYISHNGFDRMESFDINETDTRQPLVFTNLPNIIINDQNFILISDGLYYWDRNSRNYILLISMKFFRNLFVDTKLVNEENFWTDKLADFHDILRREYVLYYKTDQDISAIVYFQESFRVKDLEFPNLNPLDDFTDFYSHNYNVYRDRYEVRPNCFTYSLAKCIYPNCDELSNIAPEHDDVREYMYCEIHDTVEFANPILHNKPYMELYYKERKNFKLEIPYHERIFVITTNGNQQYITYKLVSIEIKEDERQIWGIDD